MTAAQHTLSAKPPALETDPGLPVRFFGLVKNLTADGHYTSRVACSNDWATRANSALADFPACSVPEH